MPTRVILPNPRHDCPTHTVWRNATCRRHLPLTDDHDHAGASARPNHDEFCPPAIHSKRHDHTDGAAAGPTGDAHDAPYYAPNQQPYNATNQQHPGYF
jgi:hypothetical protein